MELCLVTKVSTNTYQLKLSNKTITGDTRITISITYCEAIIIQNTRSYLGSVDSNIVSILYN
jgi:hypothetical protein